MTTGRFSPRAVQGDDDNDGYVLTTMGGVPVWLPAGSLPAGGAEGETLAKLSGTDGDADWIDGSVPIIPLPNGSDDSDVPAGTPYGSIIVFKGP